MDEINQRIGNGGAGAHGYAAHRTIQPSQEDQHAVQEKVLFISQLVYSWLAYSNTLINKVQLTPLLTPKTEERIQKTEATVLVPNLADYVNWANRIQLFNCDEIAGLGDFRPDQNGGLWLAICTL